MTDNTVRCVEEGYSGCLMVQYGLDQGWDFSSCGSHNWVRNKTPERPAETIAKFGYNPKQKWLATFTFFHPVGNKSLNRYHLTYGQLKVRACQILDMCVKS